jgi:cytochrome c-type biogenesis protein CcmH/NrfG
MSREAVLFGVAGAFFGLLVGWMLGGQAARRLPVTAGMQAAAQPAESGQPGSGQPGSGQQGGQPVQAKPATLDQQRVQVLSRRAEENPRDAAVRAELGNVYFDAEKFDEAIKWYQASLAIQPENADVSTDLGLSYYYINETEKALEQFARSLEIDPRHTKTMLNIGVVKAFGQQDLSGAARAWQQVVDLAPQSPEGRAAKQMIDTLRTSHPEAAADGKGGV